MAHYRGRVLVGNWVEEQSVAGLQPEKPKFSGISVYNTKYTPEHKYGAEIAKPVFEGLKQRCRAEGLGFLAHRHDASGHIAPHCLATMYQLTHAILGGAGEVAEAPLVPEGHNSVQAKLWQGYKKNDSQVPFASCKRELLAAKQREWAPPRPGSGFRTTQRDASLGVQDYTIEKRINCRPSAVGGQPAQIGRKAKGAFADEFDKTYQHIGLRKP